MIAPRAFAAVVTLAAFAALGLVRAMPAPAHVVAAAAERDFLRGVDRENTANRITSDVPASVGKHVYLICTVDAVVSATMLIGQCGKSVEPVDLYVQMPTGGRRAGDRFRLFGIVQTPSVWVDALGHVVYYPIVRAVITERTTLPQ